MSIKRPYVMSIAGIDPCAGAGLLADIKTFENCLTYGLGVCSSLTFQNENNFTGLKWINKDDILSQLNSLTSLYPIRFAKIGLIENISILNEIIEFLDKLNVKIIWDPILKSTTGFNFHNKFNKNELINILQKIFLLTPNLEEIKTLTTKSIDIPEELQQIIKENNLCSILLKGGHSEENEINDLLIDENTITVFNGKKYNGYQKHGTGCVLSSAITANLALGVSLENACANSKEYIHKFILSNNFILGYHK